MRLPDFYIIGAMKCATSMLQRQLASEENIFMCEPKEPNFFSDDAIYAKGMDWYADLFSDGADVDLCGEASTHYTKWPQLPDAPQRLKKATPDAKFIYLIRHPVDRLISHYLHQWTMREITTPIDEAVRQHPELWQYSLYHAQLQRWFEYFPKERFLLLTQEGLKARPHENYARVMAHLDFAGGAWKDDLPAQNVTAERIARFPFYDFIMTNPAMTGLRRRLVPQKIRQALAGQLKPPARPAPDAQTLGFLREQIEPDLAALGRLTGLALTLDNYKATAQTEAFEISE